MSTTQHVSALLTSRGRSGVSEKLLDQKKKYNKFYYYNIIVYIYYMFVVIVVQMCNC